VHAVERMCAIWCVLGGAQHCVGNKQRVLDDYCRWPLLGLMNLLSMVDWFGTQQVTA
jgi:hypothetical protein